MRRESDTTHEQALADALARSRPADADWRLSVERALARTQDLPQRHVRVRLRGLFAGGLGFATAVTAASVTVVLAIIAVNLIGQVRDRQPAGMLPSPVAIDPFVVARAAVPAEEPVAATVADGSLWVATLGGRLHRLDPSTGQPVAATSLPGNACGPVTATPGSIWVVTCTPGPGLPDAPTSLVRVDTLTGEITASVELAGHAVRQPTVFGDSLWVIEDQSQGILRPISMASATAGEAATVAMEVSDMTAAFGSLWLSAPAERTLLRFDPERGEVVDTIGLPGAPGVLISDGDSLWVALADPRAIVRVDPVRGAVTASLPVGDRAPVQLAVRGFDVWGLTADELIRIDSAGVRVIERLAVGEHSVSFPPQFTGPTYAMAVGDGIWFVPPRGEMIRLNR